MPGSTVITQSTRGVIRGLDRVVLEADFDGLIDAHHVIIGAGCKKVTGTIKANTMDVYAKKVNIGTVTTTDLFIHTGIVRIDFLHTGVASIGQKSRAYFEYFSSEHTLLYGEMTAYTFGRTALRLMIAATGQVLSRPMIAGAVLLQRGFVGRPLTISEGEPQEVVVPFERMSHVEDHLIYDKIDLPNEVNYDYSAMYLEEEN